MGIRIWPPPIKGQHANYRVDMPNKTITGLGFLDFVTGFIAGTIPSLPVLLAWMLAPHSWIVQHTQRIVNTRAIHVLLIIQCGLFFVLRKRWPWFARGFATYVFSAFILVSLLKIALWILRAIAPPIPNY